MLKFAHSQKSNKISEGPKYRFLNVGISPHRYKKDLKSIINDLNYRLDCLIRLEFEIQSSFDCLDIFNGQDGRKEH